VCGSLLVPDNLLSRVLRQGTNRGDSFFKDAELVYFFKLKMIVAWIIIMKIDLVLDWCDFGE
jgi:hypothetical protein